MNAKLTISSRTSGERTTTITVGNHDDAVARAYASFKETFGHKGSYETTREQNGWTVVSVERGAHEYGEVVTVAYRFSVADVHADRIDVYAPSVSSTVRVVEYDGEVIGTFVAGVEDEGGVVDEIVERYVAGCVA